MSAEGSATSWYVPRGQCLSPTLGTTGTKLSLTFHLSVSCPGFSVTHSAHWPTLFQWGLRFICAGTFLLPFHREVWRMCPGSPWRGTNGCLKALTLRSEIYLFSCCPTWASTEFLSPQRLPFRSHPGCNTEMPLSRPAGSGLSLSLEIPHNLIPGIDKLYLPVKSYPVIISEFVNSMIPVATSPPWLGNSEAAIDNMEIDGVNWPTEMHLRMLLSETSIFFRCHANTSFCSMLKSFPQPFKIIVLGLGMQLR